MRRSSTWRKPAAHALLGLLMLTACKDDKPDNKPPEEVPVDDWPRVESAIPRDEALEARVDALLQSMTLEEKVGQMMQVEIQEVTPAEIKQYHLGSVLNGGGSFPGQKKDAPVQDWVTLADQLWEASMDPANPHQIPLLWGTDAVHGHNNVKGATMFPHNIGLGAANDPDLIFRIAEVTAREVTRTGIDWAFAPTLAVVRDDRWGRTYEGYSEDPEIVEAYGAKVVEGLQGALAKDAKANEKVIATAKHFLGDGGTTNGKDQGITDVTESDLRKIHGRGYFTALRAGAQTVMASFSSWKNKEQGENAKALKMHGNGYLLTDVLKTKMGFDGFVISDWNGHGQVNRNTSESTIDCTNSNCPQAIKAGIDMVMVPYRADWKALITNTLASVRSGEIPEARIDDAVRRILRVKFRAGLFEKPKPSLRTPSREVGTAEHRAVAREAVRKSLVLLKNNGGTLPLSRTAKILVAGKSADSLQNQTGGWSLSWQGTGNANADFGGGTTFWQAVQKVAPNATLDTSPDGALGDATYDVAVVVIGETPYAEGQGDIGNIKTLELARLRPEDLTLINGLKAKGVKKIVTVLFSGRPLHANKELNRSDAFVAAWLPGTEGEGLTDVLFRKADGSVDFDFSGKLSFSWPRSACQTPLNRGDASYDPLYAYGYGLTYASGGADQGAYDEASPDVGCGVTGGGGTTTTPLPIFDRGNQDNWVMRIGGPSNWSGVDVAQASSSSTATPAKEISVTPVDDRNGIQWGAVKATWSGTGQLYMQSKANDGTDLQSYLNSNGALVFDARLGAAPSSAVKARVDCVYPCGGEIDVTQALKALPVGAWTEVAIPLQCFSQKGADFSNVNTPMLLYTEGTMELSVANIHWAPNKAGNVSCDGGSSGSTVQISADKDAYVNGATDALLGAPAGWSYGSGSVTVNPALETANGKVVDVVFNNVTDGGGNGGVFLKVKDSSTLLDVSPIAATGGVQFELQVLDYGGTTQGFWVKLVCDNKPDTCATGDLKTLLGRPATGTWTTVKVPFSHPDYTQAGWDATKVSSVLELLPAWDDQRGNIHFQLRNIRILKQLP
ncbi:glycoside hydrolase family 3 protein [Hyalangium gracile]|uniref:glycoside hydrolase family 3 protein n=1 Tax=Hyalangium gracile TaxID=394092 RepID=UPI001CCA749D|nr:exo 1,3/1,4-beta-D-glucan glucohydrolase [Hyalangium gracile]